MFAVNTPEAMNETFAKAFNSHQLDNLLALYEEDAILIGTENRVSRGKQQIAAELSSLLAVPGTFHARNNFCVEHGNIALLRADWVLIDPSGNPAMAGSTAEIVRRQSSGNWLYVIDHALGAGLARVL